MYAAHINETDKKIQSVKEHSENTALKCREYAVPELADLMYIIGLCHDIGKYQESFQKRIHGAALHVEHSGCGALAVREKFSVNAFSNIMAYCIMGHHSGLPDGGSEADTPDKATFCGRLKRKFEDFSAYKQELYLPELDVMSLSAYFLKDCGKNMALLIDKLAFFTRYCFSCLTDADSVDTGLFCGTFRNETLTSDFAECLRKIEQNFTQFSCVTALQQARSKIQSQVYKNNEHHAHIYFMNMPTGSGKTLCSVKFALNQALRLKKKRIIYVIPYNSIIEQTVAELERIFQESAQILRHQSTFSYDAGDFEEDYRLNAKAALENWDAQFIVTTAVQFFESLYADKRGALRKIHNLADSIIVFDEAHMMPLRLIKPCLQAVCFVTKYLHSQAVLLTATMPDYGGLLKDFGCDCQTEDLVKDRELFSLFRKCRYTYLGPQKDEELIAAASCYPSCLIVTNSRKAARRLFSLCSGEKYHLSTYMTAFDRERVIKKIKKRLSLLEQEYPDLQNVPDNKKIIVISTSLIEAGVDLDFYTAFREMSGLDSILQTGGRCNREGKRALADVFIYEEAEKRGKTALDARADITKGIIEEFFDIASEESINAYYSRLFKVNEVRYESKTISDFTADPSSLPFKQYAARFRMIDNSTVSIVAARDEYSEKLIKSLRFSGYGNARALQKYAFSVYENEFVELQKQHVVDDFGSGIYCLINADYYDENIGITFEAKDYFL